MKQLAEDIRQNNFKQVYLLFGEERYLRRYYKDKLRTALCADGDTMNTHFFDGKDISVGALIDLAETMPFLAEHRVIFINESGLFRSGGEKLAEYLTAPNESTVFIFTESEVDKRSKLYKTVQSKGHAAEFVTQDENYLMRWIAGALARDGKKIKESTVRFLIAKAGTDMDNLQSELEKLVSYCMDREVITEEDIEAICTTRINNQIFDMVSAIAERQQKKALELYYDLLALKEPPMRILSLIARQCNLLLQAKELKSKGYDNKTIGSKISLPPFIVQKYLNQASKFKVSVLKAALRQCVEAEEAVKQGRLSDRMSIEILILTVLQ